MFLFPYANCFSPIENSSIQRKIPAALLLPTSEPIPRNPNQLN